MPKKLQDWWAASFQMARDEWAVMLQAIQECDLSLVRSAVASASEMMIEKQGVDKPNKDQRLFHILWPASDVMLKNWSVSILSDDAHRPINSMSASRDTSFKVYLILSLYLYTVLKQTIPEHFDTNTMNSYFNSMDTACSRWISSWPSSSTSINL